jgi:hypothetical protein
LCLFDAPSDPIITRSRASKSVFANENLLNFCQLAPH